MGGGAFRCTKTWSLWSVFVQQMSPLPAGCLTLLHGHRITCMMVASTGLELPCTSYLLWMTNAFTVCHVCLQWCIGPHEALRHQARGDQRRYEGFGLISDIRHTCWFMPCVAVPHREPRVLFQSASPHSTCRRFVPTLLRPSCFCFLQLTATCWHALRTPCWLGSACLRASTQQPRWWSLTLCQQSTQQPPLEHRRVSETALNTLQRVLWRL